MSRAAFTLDLNRCTGCSACRLACTIENRGSPERPWRRVWTFNRDNHPKVGVFHLSLACNHCEQPACLEGCPANAYSRDRETGVVLLDQTSCLGCRYCSWVCPYGAPQFDTLSGVMEKCTFCAERLAGGKEPACVDACPVEALGFMNREADASEAPRVSGFPDVGIGPSITLQAKHAGLAPPRMSLPHVGFQIDRGWPLSLLSRLAKEWSLLVFSLAAILLVGLFVGALAAPVALSPWWFVAGGFAGLGFSVLHLGRPARLLRAGLNFRTSWVSREIVFFGFFYGAALMTLFFPFVPVVTAWIAGCAGLCSLIAMDMVYRVRGQRVRAVPHSAMASLSVALVVGLVMQSWALILASMVVKVLLYGLRRLSTARGGLRVNPLLPVYRTGFGFVLPVVVWVLTGQPSHPLAVVALVLAEIIDRAEFYAELRFLDPELQILRDLPA